MIMNYGEAIRSGFEYLLEQYPEVFCIGQGLWSPWYVGNSMTDLDKRFGMDRIIDTPVSEHATTGAAIGASLCGKRAIVIHPRVDFLLLAVDQVVNQAAKWSHMLGGQAHPAVTIRGIVNRGGQQGAQHSQALHSWFAHIPGLRVVMPTTVQDARDLLIASVLSNDPVLYIDDRWLYDQTAEIGPVKEVSLASIRPQTLCSGSDVTLVGSSYSTYLCLQTASELEKTGVSCDVIDLRVLNPLKTDEIVESVRRTGRLIVVDGGWRNCGLGGEIIASVVEALPLGWMKAAPRRITLPDAPAPTSKVLEKMYYTTKEDVVRAVGSMLYADGVDYVEARI